ncbi:chemotaxis protein CheX [Fodinibius sp. Rm-B-1B1-1]|uniref:chemotaxis protein CheX n=1 Tax=Fodinibius alkaliphilus TaxID=3140241 RepID=UPI00315A6C80
MSYSSKIYETAVETFEITCFLFPLEKDEVGNEDNSQFASSGIKTIVEFDGAAKGLVVISPSTSLLRAMAGNMLGIEEPDTKQKEEALCEVANIISGNIAPMFSRDNEICYINPPRLIDGKGDQEYAFDGAEKESVRVFLNEGVADIEVYYQV